MPSNDQPKHRAWHIGRVINNAAEPWSESCSCDLGTDHAWAENQSSIPPVTNVESNSNSVIGARIGARQVPQMLAHWNVSTPENNGIEALPSQSDDTNTPSEQCCEYHNDNCQDIEEACCRRCPNWSNNPMFANPFRYKTREDKAADRLVARLKDEELNGPMADEVEHYYSHQQDDGTIAHRKLSVCACGKSDLNRDLILRHIAWQEKRLASPYNSEMIAAAISQARLNDKAKVLEAIDNTTVINSNMSNTNKYWTRGVTDSRIALRKAIDKIWPEATPSKPLQ
jgi:hypothetical protein